MPPPPALALTPDERLMFVRWIDLGAPIDRGNAAFGWMLDDLKPTLAVSIPRGGVTHSLVHALQFGLADANSGIDLGSLSVTSSLPSGRAAGASCRSAIEVEMVSTPHPLSPRLTSRMRGSFEVRDSG